MLRTFWLRLVGKRDGVEVMAAPLERATATAGAAGVGGGTLLVLYAKSLPESSAWRDLLILVSPGISVILSAAWHWLARASSAYVHELEFRFVTRNAQRRLLSQLRDETLPEAERAEIVRVLSELRALERDRVYEQLRALKVPYKRPPEKHKSDDDAP